MPWRAIQSIQTWGRVGSTSRAGPFLNVFGRDEPSIVPVVQVINSFAIKLRKENKGEGSINFRRCIDKDVAEADRQPISLQSYGVVKSGEGEEFDSDFRQRRAGPKLSMCCREDGLKLCHQ